METAAHQTASIARSSHAEMIVLLILVPIIGFLTLTNLATYPIISGWDEGTYLQFSNNLARYGEYGTRNGDAFERLIPPGGTGPTLILPVTLALRLSNGSLVAARSVVVAYFLIALVGVYLLVRQIGGWVPASIGVLLFLIAGDRTYDMLWVSRQVLAEAPGFAFGIFGLWAWVRSWHGRHRWLIASGILIALSVVSKNQLLWLFLPGFALITIIDRLNHHQLRWAHGLVPIGGALAGYGVWYLATLWIVGPVARMSYLAALRALAGATYLHGSPGRWFYNVKVFLKNPQSWIVTIAIIYGMYRGRQPSFAGLARLVLPVFAGVGVIDFLLLAITFPRYLLPPLGFGLLCCALLIDDLASWMVKRWNANRAWRALVIGLLVAVLAGPRLAQNSQRILTTNDPSAERFAEFVDETVPAGSAVLNWEWEVEFYSRSKFVHPPYRLFPALLDTLNQRHDAILDQPRIPPGIEYLIVGPFGPWVFNDELGQRRHRLLLNEGPYFLYQIY